MKQFFGISVIIAVLIYASLGATWEGFVYPNRNDLTQHVSVGEYSSLEDCRAASLTNLASLGASATGDYECGKNCGEETGGIKICSETLR